MGRPRKHPVRKLHKASVGMELINEESLIKALEEIEYFLQTEIIEKAIAAGTEPVRIAMIANAPESSGSRERQSASTRTRWAGSRKLKQTIRAVVRPRVKFGVLVGRTGLVGPSYSEGGGHGNLFSKDHKRKVLWGQDSGVVRQVNQFVKRTADETKSAATNAVISTLKRELDRVAKQASTNG